ncbi:MAG: Hint domain-containing protein [Sulfitobacter sp.]|nr:Hint domain-containing protein [Sulfitobacter sp.]
MTQTVTQAFFLGVQADIDLGELDYVTGNAGSLVGNVYGSVASPLVDYNLIDLTDVDANGDGLVVDNDILGGLAGEGLIFDGSFSTLDSTTQFGITITYTDGTTANSLAGVLQDVGGRLFLVPSTEAASNAALSAKPIQSITLDQVTNASYTGKFAVAYSDVFVTCFAPGTLLRTPQGPVRVESLRAGDLIWTLDRGPLPIARQMVSQADAAAGSLVRMAPGSLGGGRPRRALKVSRQHRMLVSSPIAHRLFGVPEVLIAAKWLTALPGISSVRGAQPVRYHHILCPTHAILEAEGALTESLLLGDTLCRNLSAGPVRRDAFHHGCWPGAQHAVRPIATGQKARDLVRRHRKNGMPLTLSDTHPHRAAAAPAAVSLSTSR